MAMGNKLGGGGNVPEAAVKEDDGRASVALIVEIVGEKKVGMQVAGRCLAVDVGVCGREEFLVPDFTEHG